MQKNKLKITDFTPKDKYNLLDLFVNNEKTLMQVYEALFPQRNNSIYPNIENTLREPVKSG